MDRVIFVHIPKTAGTSLMTSLREDVGNTFFDYNNPMSWRSPLREGRCILDSRTTTDVREPVVFGHFLAGKYADASVSGFKKRQGHLYVTFVREPLQRAISHYHYWHRIELPGHRVWRQFRKRAVAAGSLSSVKGNGKYLFQVSLGISDPELRLHRTLGAL